jgi:hypothetical protein
MSEGTVTVPHTYRFGPLDRGGWILGMGAGQCLSLGAGLFLAGAMLQVNAHPALVLAPPLASAAVAFGSWEGRSFHEWLPVFTRHSVARVAGRTRWFAPLPLLTGTPTDDKRALALPPFLAGLSILDIGAIAWASGPSHVGIIHDQRQRTFSATIPVEGHEFSLVERAEQERTISLWGDVLAGFCIERGPVSRVRVTEWAAPTGLSGHESYLSGHARTDRNPDARHSYESLLSQAGPLAVGHQVLVTVTVDLRKVRATKARAKPDDAAVEALVEEVRLLAARLDAAGLRPGPPLSPTKIADALRRRTDPTAISRLSTRAASLAEAAGLVTPQNAAPLVTSAEWSWVRADGSLHRTYWIAEWPRLDVAPNWLEPVLLHAGGIRTFSIHYEPVPPSRSQRRIDRDSTRLAADEEQRARHGFRIGARHRRAQEAVLEREAELVSGYVELEYAGFVTVTASDEESLSRSCAEYEQVAAQAGLELRALDGRHDLGLVCCLPLGRGLARRFS